MVFRAINAHTAPEPAPGSSRALESSGTSRRLYVSGQIPITRDGVVPETFEDQARLTWANVEAQLIAADMALSNIVKVTIYLSDRKYGRENREIRQAVLGSHAPASTVIIAGIFDPAWLLEIDAIAEA